MASALSWLWAEALWVVWPMGTWSGGAAMEVAVFFCCVSVSIAVAATVGGWLWGWRLGRRRRRGGGGGDVLCGGRYTHAACMGRDGGLDEGGLLH